MKQKEFRKRAINKMVKKKLGGRQLIKTKQKEGYWKPKEIDKNTIS